MSEAAIEPDGDVLIDLDDGSITSVSEEASLPDGVPEKAQKAPSRSSKRPASKSTKKSKIWQTKVRRAITPYLPPPVTRAIVKDIDPLLAPYLGPEATVTATVALLALWLVAYIMIQMVKATRTGRAVVDDDDDTLTATSEDYDATVILTGPRTAGKTRLFYQLCFSDSNVPTLMSIKANVGIATHVVTDNERSSSSASSNSKGSVVLRYVDWPGYARINDSVLASLLKSKRVRLILVLDATQPVASAADVLDQWLSLFYEQHAKSKKSKMAPGIKKHTVLIVCHKMDLAKAKNDKRIKIQMRTELERIVTAQKANVTTNANATGAAAATTSSSWSSICPVPLELEELPFVQLHFIATTCEGGKGPSPQLVDYCRHGTIPSV